MIDHYIFLLRVNNDMLSLPKTWYVEKSWQKNEAKFQSAAVLLTAAQAMGLLYEPVTVSGLTLFRTSQNCNRFVAFVMELESVR